MTEDQYFRVAELKGAIMDATSALEKILREKPAMLTERERLTIEQAVGRADTAGALLEEICS